MYLWGEYFIEKEPCGSDAAGNVSPKTQNPHEHSCRHPRHLRRAAFAAALSSTAFAAPTKIAFIGDSITNGGQTYASYRYPLYFDLTDAGYSLDVVGSSTTLSTERAELHALSKVQYGLRQESRRLLGHHHDQFSSQKSTIAANYAPEVVTIFLGSNDVNENVSNASNNYQNVHGQYRPHHRQTPGEESEREDRHRADHPRDLDRVLWLWPARMPRCPATTLLSRPFADRRKTTASSPIVVVDQYTNYNPVALNQTSDGVHPNQYGEQLIADRFYRGLQPSSPGQAVKSAGYPSRNTVLRGSESSTTALPRFLRGQGWTFKNTANADGGIFNVGSTTSTGAAGNASTPSGRSGARPTTSSTLTPRRQRPCSPFPSNLAPSSRRAWNTRSQSLSRNRLATNTYGTTYGGRSVELLAGGIVATMSTCSWKRPAAAAFAGGGGTIVRTNTTVIAALAARGEADALLCGLEGQFRSHFGVIRRDRAPRRLPPLFLDEPADHEAEHPLRPSSPTLCVNVDPSAEEIAELTRLAADQVLLRQRPCWCCCCIRLRLYDTESSRKMRRAVELLWQTAPELEVDGEMHGDSALSDTLRQRAMPGSKLTGEANLLVFSISTPPTSR